MVLLLTLLIAELPSMESAHKAFRRDPGSPQWHHSVFHDVKDSVRSDVRRMLHSRAEVIFFSRVYRCFFLISFFILWYSDFGYCFIWFDCIRLIVLELSFHVNCIFFSEIVACEIFGGWRKFIVRNRIGNQEFRVAYFVGLESFRIGVAELLYSYMFFLSLECALYEILISSLKIVSVLSCYEV